jgi:hypothetical protein
MVHAEWIPSADGAYRVATGQRFTAEANGQADAIDEREKVVGAVDPGNLEATKGRGQATVHCAAQAGQLCTTPAAWAVPTNDCQ